MRRTALKGHALRSEGKPYRLGGEDEPTDVRRDGPQGYALCECGDSSLALPSDAARKRWHAEHKAAIRNGLKAAR